MEDENTEIRNMHLVVLVDDVGKTNGLTSEHGLSFRVEADGEVLLFDCGQSEAFIANADRLDLSLGEITAIVLSHGHYDHTGGLPSLLGRVDRPMVYMHPDALQPKYRRDEYGRIRSIGPPEGLADMLETGAQVVWTEDFTCVSKGIKCTGSVPRRTDFENVDEGFRLDSDGRFEDSMADDQSLIFDTTQGLVVLMGCAHAGAVNVLQCVREHYPDRELVLVAGGLHLLHAGTIRIERTVQAFMDLGVRNVMPCHCTGIAAKEAFDRAYGNHSLVCYAGRELNLPIALE